MFFSKFPSPTDALMLLGLLDVARRTYTEIVDDSLGIVSLQ
jgi:hypothetical protein